MSGRETGAASGWPFRDGLLIGCGFLALLLLVFFYDIVFLGKTLRASNTIATTYPTGHFNYPGGFPKFMPVYDNTPGVLEEPYQEFKAHSLHHGVFPLWNPHQAGGYPFLATMESSLLFLPEVVLYAVPNLWGWDAYILFRLWLAGIFTFWLMRALGFGRLPAFTAAYAYMFSGPILSWVTNVTMNADVVLPLLFFLIERALSTGQRRYVVLGAVAIFQIIAGGHPEHAFFALVSAAIFLAFRIASPDHAGGRARAMARAIAAFVGGIGLSAVLLLPFLEYVLRESWHVHPRGVGLQSAPLGHLITLLFPWYYSRELVTYEGWTFNTWAGGWLGLMTVWLALFTLFARRKIRASYPFLVIFLFYVLKVFGFPLVNWIGRLPVFDQVKFQLHATQNVAFGAAVLSGIAIAYLGRERHGLGRFFLPLALMVPAIAWLWRFQPPVHAPRDFLALPAFLVLVATAGAFLCARSVIRPPAFAGLLSALLFVELFVLVPRERTVRAETYQVPPYVRFLRSDPSVFRVYGIEWCLFPNTATAFGLDDIGIYEGLFVKRFARYVHALVDPGFFSEESFHAFRADVADPGSPFLDLLNLKYFILPRDTSIPPAGQAALSLKPVYQGEVNIFERTRALPRVLIVHRAGVVPDGDSALWALKSGYDVRRGVILEGTPRVRLAPGLPVEDESSIEAQTFGVNHKTFRVRMEHEGFVVVGDVHYPGWKASVDGGRADLLRANYLFQAVRVPAGEHVVQFDFAPASVRAGLVLSLLTLASLLAWAARGSRGQGAPTER